jgi:polysaccharide pyruvyl transferase WcaK-like protein
MTADRPVHYLVTCAGLPNFGDELIAATWLRHLAATRPDADVVVDCVKPRVAAAHLRGLHPRVQFTNTLWRLIGKQFAAGPREAVQAVKQDALRYAGLEPPGTARGDAGLLAAADTVHLVGGGYINRLWPQVLGLLSAVAAISERTGARAVMTGQCLWPPADGCADLVSELACQFDLADVRDEASASLIAAASPSTTGDDAFLGTALRRQAGPQAPPRVMVCVQSHLASMPVERLVAFVADTLTAWQVTEVGLLECAPGWDDEALRLAAARLPVSVRYSLADVLDGGFPADSGQTWISTRFHPHLVAAAMGASGVAVSVERDYYTTKHRSLITAGSGWDLIDDLSAVPARPAGDGYSPQRLATLKASKRELADRIYPPAVTAPDGSPGAAEPTAVPAS